MVSQTVCTSAWLYLPVKKSIWDERCALGLVQIRHPWTLPVFLSLRWIGSPSITDDHEETWSSSPLDQSPGQMQYDTRWAVTLSRTQHEYRSSLWARDSSVSLWQAPIGFLEVRLVYGTLLFIIDSLCLV